MNVVKEINSINQRELELGLTASWHDDYKDSARIFVGGLQKNMTEGDVITIFSQYGEIMDIHMPRDETTGTPKGFAFLMYEDQRSTVLAVDNLNGAKVLGRTLRVDHVKQYRQPKYKNEDGELVEPDDERMNVRPELIGDDGAESDSSASSGPEIDPEDPMRDYLIAQRKEEKAKKQEKKKSKGKHKDETPEERVARKARKKEKREKKEKKARKGKSEGMKAVESLLNSLERHNMGRRSRSRSPVEKGRASRSRSPRRSGHSRHRSPAEDYEPRRKRSRFSDEGEGDERSRGLPSRSRRD